MKESKKTVKTAVKPVVKQAVVAKKKSTVVANKAFDPKSAMKPVVMTRYEIDWSKVPEGTWCVIKNRYDATPVLGKVTKRGKNEIILCNNVRGGTVTNKKYGFRSQHSIGVGSLRAMDNNNIDYVVLHTDIPKGYTFKRYLNMAGYEPTIKKGIVSFGCKDVSNDDIRELVKLLKD